MREGSPNKLSIADPLSGSRTGAKSLFRNILAVSPCGSIFCLYPALSPTRKLLRMSILGKEDEKNLEIYTSPHCSHNCDSDGCRRKQIPRVARNDKRRSIPRWYAAIFLDPLQFFAHFAPDPEIRVRLAMGF